MRERNLSAIWAIPTASERDKNRSRFCEGQTHRIMTAEEQLYIEADKYLQALARHEDYKKLDDNIHSNERRDAIHAILEKEGAAQYFGNLGFLITQHGRLIMLEGGLYNRYKYRKRKENILIIGAISSMIAAVASVIAIIMAL